MWRIFEHRRLNKQLVRVPLEIRKRYEKWKDVIQISGIEGVRLIRGFHDEPLTGQWQGYRSSRLNLQYRVIYLVDVDRCEVLVVEVTPHDYRRRS